MILPKPELSEKISTKFASYFFDENGFFNIDFHIKFNDKIQMLDAKSHVNIIVQMVSGEKCPFVLDFSNFNYVPSAKILNFLAKNEEIHKLRTHSAVVLKNPIFRPILSQYIKIVQPDYPFKVFKTKEDAVLWLKTDL